VLKETSVKIFLCLIALCTLALAAPAETDVTGKWTGTLTTSGPDGGGPSPALLILKQTGGEITGSVGPSDDQQFPVKKGTIAGSKITLEIEPHENQSIKVELVLAGEKMTGDLTMSRDGETRTGKVEVARAK
jgi:hypothetical protein